MHRIDQIACAIMLFSVLACGGSDSNTQPGQSVGLLDYVATAPADWTPTPTSSTMRLAEFATPASGDAAGAEIVAYYFGQGQGGTVEANTRRWTAQFFTPDGGHPEPTVEQVSGGTFPVTAVTLEGAYARNVGMGGAPEEAVADQMLIAAVVATPRGNLYIQMHGPADTVRSQRKVFLDFIRTIRPKPDTGVSG